MELQIIQNKIFEVRGYRVMLDFDLAELYNIKTKVLKQAVKRNIQRFPSDFMFELDKEEFHQLVTNCDQFPSLKHSSVSPMVFTEQGVAMLSTVLRSQTAIDIDISIMRAFVLMRQMVIGYDELLKRIERELEESTDAQFSEIYQALTQLLSKPDPKPRKPIGYRIPDEEE